MARRGGDGGLTTGKENAGASGDSLAVVAFYLVLGTVSLVLPTRRRLGNIRLEKNEQGNDVAEEPKAVSSELQAAITQSYDKLIALSGGSKRRGQQMMIGAIARAVANAKPQTETVGTGDRILAVNAPTGTGKTYSYLIAAIQMALASNLRVVVSTATVSLQEQIARRDLITLQKIIPGVVPVLVKGRSRYVCNAKLAEVAGGDHVEQGDAATVAIALKLGSDLASGQWQGDVDDLSEPPAPEVWKLFTNDRNGCAGKKCSKYAECTYYRARGAIESANVLVTNHDLLLADTRAGHAALPDPEGVVYIIDEAHQLPAKAIKSLEARHALDDSRTWAMRVGALIGAIRKADRFGPCGRQAVAVSNEIDGLMGTVSEARMAIESLGKTQLRDEARPVRFERGNLPEWLSKAAKQCLEAATRASAELKKLVDLLKGEEGDYMPEKSREQFLSEVGQAIGRVNAISSVWHLMTAGVGAGAPPVAKWVEIIGADRDLRVCASPVGAGEALHETLWSKAAAVVHLSATMISVGGFDPYLQASGLHYTPGVRTLSVESPFDYAASAKLIVPRGMRSPKDAEGHTKDLIRMIPSMLRKQAIGEGSLVLFSSLSQMRLVAEAMPQWVQDMLIMQGSTSKREMLRLHGEAIAAGRSSVLFGSSSMEEGVDLPGNLCTLVVVAKLQFSVPTHPVDQALREFLTDQSRSHFDEIAVPEACNRLAQSAGRLIRSVSDTGSVVVADPRLTNTPYGQRMLKALPPYRLLTTSMEVLCEAA